MNLDELVKLYFACGPANYSAIHHDFRKRLLARALELSDGRIYKVAKLLNMKRYHLDELLKYYSLKEKKIFIKCPVCRRTFLRPENDLDISDHSCKIRNGGKYKIPC